MQRLAQGCHSIISNQENPWDTEEKGRGEEVYSLFSPEQMQLQHRGSLMKLQSSHCCICQQGKNKKRWRRKKGGRGELILLHKAASESNFGEKRQTQHEGGAAESQGTGRWIRNRRSLRLERSKIAWKRRRRRRECWIILEVFEGYFPSSVSNLRGACSASSHHMQAAHSHVNGDGNTLKKALASTSPLHHSSGSLYLCSKISGCRRARLFESFPLTASLSSLSLALWWGAECFNKLSDQIKAGRVLTMWMKAAG